MGIFQFLSRNGCFTDKSNERTHNIMSGGTLYVSEDNYDDFLGMYAKEILKGNRTLSYSEIRSDKVFRMYFDVDITETKVLGTEFLLKLSRSIQSTLVKFFPGLDQDCLKCVVCSTATKRVDISELIPVPHKPKGLPLSKKKEDEPEPEPERVTKTFIKNGYHLIFPFLRVDINMALQLRFSVVMDIEKSMGKRTVATNPWLDVIDKAPYHSGLKMCGSVKPITCTECKGKKKNIRKKPSVVAIIKDIRRIRRSLYPRRDNPDFDYSNVMSIEKDEFKNEDLAELYSKYQDETGHFMCPTCGDKGWHLEDRFYMPTHILNGDGSISDGDLEYLNSDYHELVRWTSIRCRPSDAISEHYAIPDGYGSPTPDRATSSLAKAGSHLERLSPGIYREAINSDMYTNDAIGIKTWKGDEITDVRVIELITKQVRSFDIRYKDLDVRQVFNMSVAKTSTKSVISVDEAGKNNSAVEKSLPSARNKSNPSTVKALGNMMKSNGVKTMRDIVIHIMSRILVRVSGPSSTYCINKGDEHTTNSIYFWITKEHGIAQKCFSRKENIGISTKTCKEFTSEFQHISSELSALLFKQENLFDTEKKRERSVEPKKKNNKNSKWAHMC